MSTQKYQSLHDLGDSPTGSLFVLNTADKIIEGGGDITLEVHFGKNGLQTITVPRTWIPVDIAMSVPAKYIVESVSFINAVREGGLTILTPEYAKELQRDPMYNEEAGNLKEYMNSQRSAVTPNKGLAKNVRITTMSDEMPDNNQSIKPNASRNKVTQPKGKINILNAFLNDSEPEQSVEQVEEVSANFISWVTKLNSLTEKGATSELRTKGELTHTELNYVINELKHAGIVDILTKSAVQE